MNQQGIPAESALKGQVRSQKPQTSHRVFSEFPYATEQGIFAPEQGIWIGVQGINPAQQGK